MRVSVLKFSHTSPWKPLPRTSVWGSDSSSLLGLVFVASESRYDKCEWPRWSHDKGFTGLRSSFLAILRYEDDLIAMSHTLCACCIRECVLSVYGSEALFEENIDHEHSDAFECSNKFLDMVVRLSASDCIIDLFHTNAAFALDENHASGPTKFRFAPPIGLRRTIVERLTSNLCPGELVGASCNYRRGRL